MCQLPRLAHTLRLLSMKRRDCVIMLCLLPLRLSMSRSRCTLGCNEEGEVVVALPVHERCCDCSALQKRCRDIGWPLVLPSLHFMTLSSLMHASEGSDTHRESRMSHASESRINAIGSRCLIHASESWIPAVESRIPAIESRCLDLCPQRDLFLDCGS